MKKILFILTAILFSVVQLTAQPGTITLKTAKKLGESINLKLVAGGNVSIDMGNGITESIDDVSKNYKAPTSHSLILTGNTGDIVIYGVNLTYLDCAGNELIWLDVSNSTKLRTLKCQNNKLKALDVQNNTALNRLWCGDNQIQKLGVQNNQELTELSCSKNKISSLDVSNNPLLRTLICSKNALGELNVSSNPKLRALDARNIGISKLDLSNNTELTGVSIHNDGPNQANSFDACSLNALYNTLPIQVGTINVINSGYKGKINNDANGSNKLLANNRGWLVFDKNDEKELTGNGGACK